MFTGTIVKLKEAESGVLIDKLLLDMIAASPAAQLNQYVPILPEQSLGLGFHK